MGNGDVNVIRKIKLEDVKINGRNKKIIKKREIIWNDRVLWVKWLGIKWRWYILW